MRPKLIEFEEFDWVYVSEFNFLDFVLHENSIIYMEKETDRNQVHRNPAPLKMENLSIFYEIELLHPNSTLDLTNGMRVGESENI